MILDYDHAFREQYQFLPPADALNAADARQTFELLRQFGEKVHEHCLEGIQELEAAIDVAKEDLDTAKGALEELKCEILNALNADIPNLSDIRKLCET